MTRTLDRPAADVDAARQAPLPGPVRRWLEVARPELRQRPRTIYMSGSARFKRGRMPYLPMRIRVWNRLGRDRVSELEVRILHVTLMRGLDAYVDGRGFTRVGSQLSVGPEVDQGAFHVLLLETLTFPNAWPEDLAWEAIDDHHARVVAPFKGGHEAAVIGFNPRSGLPEEYRTDRYKVAGSPKVGWTGRMKEWQAYGGVLSPSVVEAEWADEAQPWLIMRIERLEVNRSMEEPLHRARLVLAETVGRLRAG